MMGRPLALLGLVVNSMDQIHSECAMSGDTTQGLTLAGTQGLLTADQAGQSSPTRARLCTLAHSSHGTPRAKPRQPGQEYGET